MDFCAHQWMVGARRALGLILAGLLCGWTMAMAAPASATASEVMAWGANDQNQLANATVESSDAPLAVSGLSGVRAMSAGGEHSLALLNDGTVMAWGANEYGQLGDGPTAKSAGAPASDGLTATTAAAGLSHRM